MGDIHFRWGTVTDVSPLRVRLDADSTELPFTPDSLIDPLGLEIADRVRCELSGHRLTIHGRSGGFAIPESPWVTGMMMPWGAVAAPTGFLLCDGTAQSRSTYASLFDFLNPTVGTFTVTIATPGVATLTAHGMRTGQMVYLTTTGALPTGLSANTAYYVIRVTADTFRLATSLANALAGTAINTTGSQSGTHTLRTTFGVGNGSTTFNVLNLAGRAPVGLDTAQAEFAALGQSGGAKTHTLVTSETPAHRHQVIANVAQDSPTTLTGSNQVARSRNAGNDFSYGVDAAGTSTDATVGRSSEVGGGGAHNNLQPYLAMNWIIKT